MTVWENLRCSEVTQPAPDFLDFNRQIASVTSSSVKQRSSDGDYKWLRMRVYSLQVRHRAHSNPHNALRNFFSPPGETAYVGIHKANLGSNFA